MHQITFHRPRRQAGLIMVSTALAALLALSGCAGAPVADAGATRDTSSATASQPEAKTDDALRNAAISSTRTMDYVAAAAYWGNLYERNQDNPENAVGYSRALRQIGSVEQAGTVMQRAQALHRDNVDVLAEYGKVLTETGRPDQAVPLLDHAASLSPKDWTIPSATGVALDQMGKYAEAQAKYQAALRLDPGNPSVLTNLGLSYALQGDLDKAEQTLRQAVADPRATAQARQNLVIVLGLKGNFDEATRLARADLPPEVAQNNISYLRDMLTQPALWKQMEQIDKKPAAATTPDDDVSSMPPSTSTTSLP